MIISVLILVMSGGLFAFYLQGLCKGILKREFDRAYFQMVVGTGLLEFVSLRETLQSSSVPLDYARCSSALQCDLVSLRYLLKHAGNLREKLTWQERLLLLYYHFCYAVFVLRHRMGMNERPAGLKMTEVLRYFANVVGERNFRPQTQPLPVAD